MRVHVRRGEARARRHLRRHAAALRDRGRAARHGRPGAARLRRGGARGPPARTERRRAHRHRPDRGDRAARAHRRPRHARALPGGGHVELRRGAHGRGRRSRGVHREGRRRRADQPDQRGRVRDRARRASSGSRPGRAVSFEREVFPSLVGDGLYGYDAAGYWIDIGTPERYLEATWDLLAGRVASTLPPRDETGSLVYEDCLVVGRARGPAERARPALLGGDRRARGALGAPRPRARRRGRRGGRGRARRARARRRARADRAGGDGGRRRGGAVAGARVEPGRRARVEPE